jgi:serine/threonine protein kinase
MNVIWILLVVLLIVLALLRNKVIGGFSLLKNCLVNDCCEKDAQISKLGKILGPSAVAYVHEFTADDGNTYVVKIMSGVDISNEIEVQKYLANAGIKVPQIYDAWTCNGKQYIVMEKIVGYTLSDVLKDKIHINDDAWKEFAENVYRVNQPYDKLEGVFHKDVHSGNAMWDTVNNTFYLIDFGPSKLMKYKDVEHLYDVRYEDQYGHYHEILLKNPEAAAIIAKRWDELDIKAGNPKIFSQRWAEIDAPYFKDFIENEENATIDRLFRRMAICNELANKT